MNIIICLTISSIDENNSWLIYKLINWIEDSRICTAMVHTHTQTHTHTHIFECITIYVATIKCHLKAI